jgi:hypothetical protein
MMKLPKARTENILEQNLEKETLIYDLNINKAFNLNETLSVVYKACGQNLTFDDLRRESKFTDDFIFLALDELKRNNLLAESFDSPLANTNRREVIKKVGLTTMFALPLIAGLIAPRAANAASNAGGIGGGFELFGACDSNGVCYNTPDSRNLSCVGSKCCLVTPVGTGSLMPGDAISIPQTCTSDPGATVSCSDLSESQGYCCSGNVSGSCVAETEYPKDANGDIAACYYADGSYGLGYITTCNCYCA